MSKIYFNNAATSWPKPDEVKEAIAGSLQKMPSAVSRAGYNAVAVDVFQSCRMHLANILDITSENALRIVLTENATKASNIALLGFPWNKDAVVLVDAASHNSILRPLHYLQSKGVLKYCVLPTDTVGRVHKDSFFRALSAYRPQMVILTHASNVSGAVNDAGELFFEAKKNNAVTFIDAAQTAGIIDIAVQDMSVDLLLFTGHKYLLGPQGTGGLYTAPGIEIQPTFTGGTGVRSDLPEMPPEMPIRLECGTPNEPAFAGLEAALRWQTVNGLNIRENLRKKFFLLRDKLQEASVRIIDAGDNVTPTISFIPNNWSVEEVGQILEQSFGIVCRTGLHCAPLVHQYIGSAPQGTVRLSLSVFTTEQEIDYVCDAIKKL